MKTLNSISDIKEFFKSNTTPIYFISATNFNLLGMDEWVNNFKYISHIDSYEGKHPNLFSPKEEVAHEEFTSIEDINNYLLQHPEVINYMKSNAVNGDMGKALFLMFDEKTEQLGPWPPRGSMITYGRRSASTVTPLGGTIRSSA